MLEAVAERRIANEWGLTGDWQGYQVLVAVEDCRLLNRRGWLITNGNVYSAITVDCLQAKHSMNGIMADTSLDTVGRGWLVLR